MDFERKAKLDKIGFELSVEDEKWNLQFKKLRDYYEKHGHCELFWAVDRFTSFILNIPTNIPPVSLPELQAMCHKSTRTRNWAPGSSLSVPPSKMVKWIRNELKSSKKLGSLSISRARRTRIIDPQLGTWVDTQRCIFQKGRMDFERKEKLDKIGFEFSVKNKENEEKWDLQFKKLRDYYGKHGHCELFWAVDCRPIYFNLEYPH
jgi:hypothetical protein